MAIGRRDVVNEAMRVTGQNEAATKPSNIELIKTDDLRYRWNSDFWRHRKDITAGLPQTRLKEPIENDYYQ